MAIVHWINGAGGSWNTKTNWDTQQVPTSSDDVSIDASGTYIVAVSSPGVANSLTISSGETVEIQSALNVVNGLGNAGTVTLDNNTSFSLGGTVTNSATGINLNSTGNFTDLIIAGTVTLQGSGNIVFSDVGSDGTNRIYSNNVGSVLDNVNNTISGAGEIIGGGLSLTNEASGVIDATGTHALHIHNIVITNTGILEATGAGGLLLQSVTLNNTNNSNGGQLKAVGTGNNVYLNSGTIIGGSLITSGGGLIESIGGGPLLDGSNAGAPVVITTGSTVQVNDGANLQLKGTITNNGTLSLAASTTSTDLLVASGTVTLQGGGQVTLSDVATINRNRIYSNNTGSVLDNVNNTISGAGQIFGNPLSLTNEAAGVIDATGTNALDIHDITVTNNGLLEATNTGGLDIFNATVNNTGNSNGGQIKAVGSGNNVYLGGGTIIGGSLITSGGGLIESTGSAPLFDGSNAGAPVVITTGSTVQINDGAALSLKGTITNNGTLSLAASTATTDLLVASGTVTLQGGGNLVLADTGTFNRSRIYSNTAGSVLDNVNNTISGAGQIFSNGGNLSLTNEAAGLIDANGAHALEIDHITLTNSGLLEATSAGGLEIFNATVNDTGNSNGGQIKAVSTGNNVNLGTDTVVGGSLIASGGGLIAITGNSVLDGSTIAAGVKKPALVLGTCEITDSAVLTIDGTINLSKTVNKQTTTGTIALQSAGGTTELVVGVKNASLGKGGFVTLSDKSGNFISGTKISSKKVSSLSNSATISGAGTIGSELLLTNAGTIDASGSNALIIHTGDAGVAKSNIVNNSGLIEATNPNSLGSTGGLRIASSIITGKKSTVEANGATTHVDLQSATIQGGTLITLAGGVIQAIDQGNVLDGSSVAAGPVNNKATVNILDGTFLTIRGTINNTGSINLQSGGDDTRLRVGTGGATLSGGGTVTLGNNNSNRIDAAVAGVTLTNTNDIIQGGGQLGFGSLGLSNSGTINANVSTTLEINTGGSTITNNGTLEATGGTLQVDQDVSGTGSATIAGGRLDFLGAFSQNVAFTGTSGELDLAHTLTTDSQHYAGSISGMQGNSGDVVVLEDMNFVGGGQTTATYNTSTHVLAVTNGTATADISILGTYSANSFVAVDHGNGKVEIHDPPLV